MAENIAFKRNFVSLMRRITTFLTLLLLAAQAFSQDSLQKAVKKYKIVKFSIHEEIAPSATRITTKALQEAERLNADLIILDMDTYGGLVSDADSIRTRILKNKIPVYVFVENNAASAGALISIACHKIFMSKTASIGAATVVGEGGQKAPDKYQSYMRSKMRATAEARGRNPDIAEAMVDEDIVVPGVSDSGKILTLTTSEAIKNGFCDGQAESVEEVLKLSNITDYDIIEVKPDTIDGIMGFLLHPGTSGVLLLVIFLGIYYELQSPGLGFPSIIALAAGALYFAPLYLEGLANNWEILMFIIGLGLLLVEIFAIPGFGVAGISGIALIFVSLVLGLVRNVTFDFSFEGTGELGWAVIRVMVSLGGFVLFLILFGASFFKSKLFQRMVLADDLSESRVNVIERTKVEFGNEVIGKEGVVFDNLKPQGKIRVDGKIYPATSMGDFIEKDTAVLVIKELGGLLVVRKVE